MPRGAATSRSTTAGGAHLEESAPPSASGALGFRSNSACTRVTETQSPKSSEPAPLTSSSVKAEAAAEPLALRNLKSQKYIQPSGGSTSVGARLVQQPLSSGAWQSWWLVADGSFTTFWNDNSGLNAGIDGASTSAGAAAIQATPSGDLNQDWTLNWRSDSVFEVNYLPLK